MVMKIDVDPNQELQKSLNKTIRKLGDITIPLMLISRSWFKGNVSQFDKGRKSRGKYADLSTNYKNLKKKYIGSAYPILRGFIKVKGSKARKSGKLADSMTDPRNKYAVNLIVNKKSLIMGTKVRNKKGKNYAFYLNDGTKFMPARKVVLFGSEQVATSQQNKRVQGWVYMLEKYARDVTEKP